MILRRLYLYLVSAAALVVLAAGLVLLGGTILLFLFNDPTADRSRGQLAIFTAMTVVAAPVWAVHFLFAQRFASRDPYERASALRRLYLYWACLAGSLAAMVAVVAGVGQLLQPYLDNLLTNWLSTAQIAWAAAVFAAVWGLHFFIAWRDRAAVGEEGASSTLRRWYMYIALLVGLLTVLAGTASLLQAAWIKATIGDRDYLPISLAGPGGLALGGLLLWAVHGRVIAINHITEDRHSTLRALEGFIAVAISIAVALVGASQILYYALDRALGVSNPAGVSSPNLLEALAAPGSQLLVYGVAWILIRRRLQRDAEKQEADRQAAIRRLYTNLAALISLASWGYGGGLLLATLAEQAEAPIIGVKAGDWRDPVSLALTLTVVGGAVWVAHWRHEPWAADRQSLSRKLYVWAALLGSVLAVLGGGVGIVNAVLQQVFSANPRLNAPSNLDFGKYLGVIAIAVGVAVYHWTVLRADSAARPHKPAAAPAPQAPVASTPMSSTAMTPAAEVLGPHARRYTLVVNDATDDDVHQALSSLPPQSSYHLTPTEQAVDGH
ncbi:MAG TPA: DUF5671 domain-containing protein [Candidatus Dormibacteraeota bacterium]|nr:DUF5671 domain-containing protein [Candidatus Dormibacteraeota bacterium]